MARAKKQAPVKMRLKKGDQVRVISGKHRGAEGKIISVLRDSNRVIVENINVVKKTQRPTQQNPRGGFRDQELPIHASNVQIIDPETGEPTRIGYKVQPSGEKVRISRRSGNELDKK